MQGGVREEEMKLNEMEQALAGMNTMEMLVLGMDDEVSLRCHYTRLANCQVHSAQGMLRPCSYGAFL